jgi:hypothetical protein
MHKRHVQDYVVANGEEDRATVRRIATFKRCRLGQGDRLHAGRRAVYSATLV